MADQIAVSSNNDIESLEELEANKESLGGGEPTPVQEGAPAPAVQPGAAQPIGTTPQPDLKAELEALKAKYAESEKFIAQARPQLGRVSAYQHRLDTLEKLLKQQQQAPQPTNPEEAAQVKANQEFIDKYLGERYGLTPEMAQSWQSAAQMQQAQAGVSQFVNATRQMAGANFDKLEKYATKLVDEHWDKAMQGDQASQNILNSPGNLLWFAQQAYAADAEAQNKNLVDSRTRQATKPTLKPGSTPVSNKGEIAEDELNDLEPTKENIERLERQISKNER